MWKNEEKLWSLPFAEHFAGADWLFENWHLVERADGLFEKPRVWLRESRELTEQEFELIEESEARVSGNPNTESGYKNAMGVLINRQQCDSSCTEDLLLVFSHFLASALYNETNMLGDDEPAHQKAIESILHGVEHAHSLIEDRDTRRDFEALFEGLLSEQ